MSATAQVIDIASAAPKGKSKKKLIMMVAGLLVLGAAGGGGWYWWSHKNGAHTETAAEAKEKAHKAALAAVPVFLPLESLVVNLAGRDGERLAQVGITLQLVDQHTADTVKLHMPSIRSGILLTVAHHTAEELLLPEGKEALAVEIMRQVTLPLGFDPDAKPAAKTVAEAKDGKDGKDAKEGAAPKEAKEGAEAAEPAVNPVQKVLFSSLIIQ